MGYKEKKDFRRRWREIECIILLTEIVGDHIEFGGDNRRLMRV